LAVNLKETHAFNNLSTEPVSIFRPLNFNYCIANKVLLFHNPYFHECYWTIPGSSELGRMMCLISMLEVAKGKSRLVSRTIGRKTAVAGEDVKLCIGFFSMLHR
jgi:hypothetical protein